MAPPTTAMAISTVQFLCSLNANQQYRSEGHNTATAGRKTATVAALDMNELSTATAIMIVTIMRTSLRPATRSMPRAVIPPMLSDR